MHSKAITARLRGSAAAVALLVAVLVTAAGAQQAAPAEGKPKFQVNFLNSCRPSPADVDEMLRALAQLKERPAFSADFEISRGVTTLSEEEARAAGAPAGSGERPSAWVRVRHEFAPKALLTDAQYSLSVDGSAVSEVLALHLRDPKQVLQVLISDTVTGTAEQVLRLPTPPDRIRVERFGRSSLVLARCGGMDQSAYEPVFAQARDILDHYRRAMAVQKIVPGELSRLPQESKSTPVNH